MPITTQQKRKILQVLNVFETGRPEGVYNNIVIYKDGPVVNGAQVYQITYGRSQTTEFGNLPRLVAQYIADGGLFAADFKRYTARLGKQPSLRDDMTFRARKSETSRMELGIINAQETACQRAWPARANSRMKVGNEGPAEEQRH